MTSNRFLNVHGNVTPLLFMAMDAVMIVLGACLATAILWSEFWPIPGYYRGLVYVSLLFQVGTFPVMHLYRSWQGQQLRSQCTRVTLGWLAVVLGMILVGAALKISNDYSRIWFILWSILSWGLLMAGRLLVQSILNTLRRQGINIQQVLVIGSEALAHSVVTQAPHGAASGWNIRAVALTDYRGQRRLNTTRALAYSSKTEYLARRLAIDEIWICLQLGEQETIERILGDLRYSTATIRLMPSLQGIRLIRHPVSQVLGLPMLNLSVAPMQGINRLIKAVEDRTLSAIILLLISPLLLALAAGVKISSPGPVFFRQERMGWNGQLFNILKFRSMPTNVESKTGAVWARQGEKRATRFGSFLRSTSLDELPQFINVLLGDMSIVGPRPERPVFVHQFKEEIPGYMQKHMVKAGITGWAQVNGWRGSTDLAPRIEHDLYYIENWSLWFDLKIILMTLFKGFIHRNAY